tara:strand:+ start:441 stop:956 length:516 start_codon:yes stop_codon:yes gene_type:complete
MEQLQVGVLLVLGREDAREVFEAARTDRVAESVDGLLSRLEESGGVEEIGTGWALLHATLVAAGRDSEEVSFTLSQCLLGGRSLGGEETKTIAKFVRPDLVLHVARELEALERDTFLSAWQEVLAEQKPELPAHAAEIEPWQRIKQIRGVYQLAGEQREAVLFMAVCRDAG